MKGIYTIQKYKSELINGEWVPNELIEEIEVKNDITYGILRQWQKFGTDNNVLAISYDSDQVPSPNISVNWMIVSTRQYKGKTISGQNIHTFETDTTVDTIEPIKGYDIGGIDRVQFIDPGDGSDGYFEFQQRWSPTTVDRTIYSVGLVYTYSNNLNWFSGAYLSTPCIQASDETIQIKYRIYLNFTSVLQYQSSIGITDTDNIAAMSRDVSLGAFEGKWHPDEYWFTGLSPEPNENVFRSVNFTEVILPVATRVLSDNYLLAQISGTEIGKFHHALAIKSDVINHENLTHKSKFRDPTATVIQNTFHKRTVLNNDLFSANRPFSDIAAIGTGTGKAILTDTITVDTSWTGTGWPTCYKVEIISGGGTGTSTYQLSKRVYPGFNDGGSYLTRPEILQNLPCKYPYVEQFVTDKHRGTVTDDVPVNPLTPANYIYMDEYILPEFISANFDGINIWNLDVRVPPVILDIDSTPALPCTDIRQIRAFDNGNIIVACAETGLWKIVRTPGSAQDIGTTITQIIPAGAQTPNKCYGCCTSARITDKDYNNGAKWYALFGQEFGYSTDAGVTWTILNNSTSPQYKLTNFADTDGTVANGTKESNICGLFIDYWAKAALPANERFAIVTPDVLPSIGSSGQLHWWSTDGSVGTSNEVRCNLISGKSLNAPLHATKGIYVIKISDGQGTGGYRWSIANDSASSDSFTYFGKVDQDGTWVRSSSGQPMPIYNAVTNDEWVASVDNAGTNRQADFIPPANFGGGTPALTGSIRYGTLANEVKEDAWEFVTAYIGGGLLLSAQSDNFDSERLCIMSSLSDDTSSVSRDFRDNRFGVWETYGWNGISWEKNHAGTKLTHAADADIIDGLKLKFDDPIPSAGSFIASEFFDIYVADGIFKDDVTEFDIDYKIPYIGSVTDNTFSPALLPGSPRGSVVADPLLLQSKSSVIRFNEPSWAGFVYDPTPGVQNYGGDYSQQILIGDFSIKFKYYAQFANENKNNDSFFGLELNITKSSWAIGALAAGDSGHPRIGMSHIFKPGATTGEEITLQIRDENINSEIPLTDYLLDDNWEFRRTSGVIELYRNTVLLYTFTDSTSANDMVVVFRHDNLDPFEIDDCLIDYDDQTYFIETGALANDINFREQILYDYADNNMELFLDGTPATIITNTDLLPAAGELMIGRSGRIGYNVADAGKTITGDYRFALKLRLQDNP